MGSLLGGEVVTTVLGPGGCPGMATAGCDRSEREAQGDTNMGAGHLRGPQAPSMPWGGS